MVTFLGAVANDPNPSLYVYNPHSWNLGGIGASFGGLGGGSLMVPILLSLGYAS